MNPVLRRFVSLILLPCLLAGSIHPVDASIVTRPASAVSSHELLNTQAFASVAMWMHRVYDRFNGQKPPKVIKDLRSSPEELHERPENKSPSRWRSYVLTGKTAVETLWQGVKVVVLTGFILYVASEIRNAVQSPRTIIIDAISVQPSMDVDAERFRSDVLANLKNFEQNYGQDDQFTLRPTGPTSLLAPETLIDFQIPDTSLSLSSIVDGIKRKWGNGINHLRVAVERETEPRKYRVHIFLDDVKLTSRYGEPVQARNLEELKTVVANQLLQLTNPHLYAVVQLRSKDGEPKALETLRMLIRDKADPVVIALLGVEIYSRPNNAADYEKALSYAQQLQNLQPDSALTQAAFGRVYMAQEDWPQAIAAYKRLQQIDPKDSASYVNLVRIYRELDQPDEALLEIYELIKRNPDDEVGYQWLIYSLDWTEASDAKQLEIYDWVLARHWNLEWVIQKAELQEKIALAQANQDPRKANLDPAIETLKQGIARLYGNESTYQLLARLYRDKGDIDRALKTYQDLIDIDPTSARDTTYANYLMQAGKYEEAAAIYLDNSEYQVQYQLNYGQALMAMKQYDAAIQTYREVIKDHNDYVQFHEALAEALEAVGRKAEAAQQRRTAQRLTEKGAPRFDSYDPNLLSYVPISGRPDALPPVAPMFTSAAEWGILNKPLLALNGLALGIFQAENAPLVLMAVLVGLAAMLIFKPDFNTLLQKVKKKIFGMKRTVLTGPLVLTPRKVEKKTTLETIANVIKSAFQWTLGLLLIAIVGSGFWNAYRSPRAYVIDDVDIPRSLGYSDEDFQAAVIFRMREIESSATSYSLEDARNNPSVLATPEQATLDLKLPDIGGVPLEPVVEWFQSWMGKTPIHVRIKVDKFSTPERPELNLYSSDIQRLNSADTDQNPQNSLYDNKFHVKDVGDLIDHVGRKLLRDYNPYAYGLSLLEKKMGVGPVSPQNLLAANVIFNELLRGDNPLLAYLLGLQIQLEMHSAGGDDASGAIAQATIYAEEIRKRNAKQGYVALALVHRQLKDLQSAEENFKKALELDPNDMHLYFSMVALKSNDTDFAEGLFEIMKKWPRIPHVYNMALAISRIQHNEDQFLKVFNLKMANIVDDYEVMSAVRIEEKRALEKAENDPKKANFERCIQLLRMALSVRPRQPAYRRYLALLYLRQSRFKEALDALDYRDEDKSLTLRVLYADILEAQASAGVFDRSRAALRIYEDVVRTKPASPFNYGKALFALGRYKEAVQALAATEDELRYDSEFNDIVVLAAERAGDESYAKRMRERAEQIRNQPLSLFHSHSSNQITAYNESNAAPSSYEVPQIPMFTSAAVAWAIYQPVLALGGATLGILHGENASWWWMGLAAAMTGVFVFKSPRRWYADVRRLWEWLTAQRFSSTQTIPALLPSLVPSASPSVLTSPNAVEYVRLHFRNHGHSLHNEDRWFKVLRDLISASETGANNVPLFKHLPEIHQWEQFSPLPTRTLAQIREMDPQKAEHLESLMQGLHPKQEHFLSARQKLIEMVMRNQGQSEKVAMLKLIDATLAYLWLYEEALKDFNRQFNDMYPVQIARKSRASTFYSHGVWLAAGASTGLLPLTFIGAALVLISVRPPGVVPVRRILAAA